MCNVNHLMGYDAGTGDINGFWLADDAHPDGCVEITEDVWLALLSGYTQFRLTLPAPDGVIDTIDAFHLYTAEPVDGRSEEQKIHDELYALDAVLPRSTEDLIEALQLDVERLPQIMQDRIAAKQSLRARLNTLL